MQKNYAKFESLNSDKFTKLSKSEMSMCLGGSCWFQTSGCTAYQNIKGVIKEYDYSNDWTNMSDGKHYMHSGGGDSTDPNNLRDRIEWDGEKFVSSIGLSSSNTIGISSLSIQSTLDMSMGLCL